MISIKINDTNNLMQKLLIEDIFDSFLIREYEIHTSCTYAFQGKINEAFYDTEELEQLRDDFVPWKQIKHICFEIIKGKKTPTKMKFVFLVSRSGIEKIISESGFSLSPDTVGGLYLHFSYENGESTIITGTTLNIFTLDKSLDQYWDKLVLQFMQKHFDAEIIE